ncbi:MAG: TonB-dependent receptor [Cyclobacteriaceae bacterium]
MKQSILLWLAMACFHLHGQQLTQTIKGQVKDAQSGSPIIGVNVVVIGTDPIKGATTDLYGRFKIENVAVGRHNIKATFIGYEELVIPEVLVGSGKEVILDIPLRESLVKLDEIVISADEQNKGEPLNEMAAISALSFSVEETSRYAATFDDPARAALSFAGVRGGGDDVLNEIVIRGNSPKGLLWRIEGIEIPNPNHFAEDGSSGGGISMLSSSMLANSDFYTGAFPAEYGNALSGVFDIKLRKGNTDKREYAFQAGLLGVAMAAEGPFGKDSKASYLANYRYSTLALFDNIGVKILGEDEEIVFQDLSFKVHLPTKKAGSFSIWGLGGASADLIKANTENGSYYNEDFRTKLGVGGISHTFYLNKDTYLESQITYSAHHNKYVEDSLRIQEYYRENFLNTALRGGVLLNKKFDARHTLRTGGFVSHMSFDLFSEFWLGREQRFITDIDQKGSSQFMQYYGQWQYRMLENLTFNTGFHYSHFLLNDNNAFEPRFSMKWEVSPRHTISAGLGWHSRMESFSVYKAQVQQPNGQFVRPNEDLDFTKSRHYVVGYQVQLKPDLRFKAEAYYQDLYDVPIRQADPSRPWRQTYSVLNQSDGFIVDTLVNNGTGENYGLELTLEKFFTRNYYFMATGSIFESKYVGADGIKRDSRFNGNFIMNFIGGKEFKVGRGKNNMIGLNLRTIWSGNNREIPIDLAASMTNGSEVYNFENSYSRRMADYWRIDFGIRYRKNKKKHSSIIALNIQNVTGRENQLASYYSNFNQSINYDSQLAMFPNLSYRIEF